MVHYHKSKYWIVSCEQNKVEHDILLFREYFSVTGPKTIRANEEYSFAITSHSVHSKSKKIRVAIEGSNDFEDDVFIYKDLKVESEETIQDTLDVT